jgi:CPA1 family monovalent cation:H+ antiporter
LRLEEREYDVLFEDGLIGRELHTSLKQEVAVNRRKAEARPALDGTFYLSDAHLLDPA